MEVLSRSHLKMRVWERGAGKLIVQINISVDHQRSLSFCFLISFQANLKITGATLACGTGACALVVAAVLEGRANRVSLEFKKY